MIIKKEHNEGWKKKLLTGLSRRSSLLLISAWIPPRTFTSYQWPCLITRGKLKENKRVTHLSKVRKVGAQKENPHFFHMIWSLDVRIILFGYNSFKKLSLASIPSQQSCSKEQASVDHCKSVTSQAVWGVPPQFVAVVCNNSTNKFHLTTPPLTFFSLTLI